MITVNASRREPICLRHQGENDAMRVAFPLSAFEADWPGGTPLLLVQRPRSSRDAEAYPVALSVDGHTAYWTVSASDIEYSGYGKVQLQWRVEDVLVKSCIYDTVCVPSLHAGAEPPDEPSKRWFDAIQAQIGNLDDLTTEEKENLVAAINEAARSGGGGSGTVTEADIEKALGYKPIGADDVPVKKVNGATGDVKSTFYVTITSAEDESISADKTLEEIYAAYDSGYAVYAKVATTPPIILPLTMAVHLGNNYAVVFNGAVTFVDTTEYAISNEGSGWTIYAKDIAFKDNIPTIPTALKNPHPLNIKIGNATTIYDGSAEQTVEIPDGGTGKDGKDGITPTIGTNGNWYLGDEDTGKPSRGADGAPGKDGANGAPGKDGTDGAPGKDGTDGHTPVITASKSGKVTTIKADGETIATVNDGADGANGKDGTNGAPGKDGADGAPGKDGVTPDIQIGTVTTLPAGSAATASMGGTAAQPTLNLGIPKGANGNNANVTKDAVVGALGFTPISADDVPVKSVNGQTGEAKTNWYFNVTGSVFAPTTTQTAAQIVAAQESGFAPICSATFSDFKGLPATLPALLISDMACVFGGIGSTGGNTFYLTVMIDGAGNLTAKTDDVAAKGDIPTIPTALKNPNALDIKIGNTTTSYDGSAAKTVEIPEGGPTDAQVSSAVSSWLTEHPEATTTVQDGAVSPQKTSFLEREFASIMDLGEYKWLSYSIKNDGSYYINVYNKNYNFKADITGLTKIVIRATAAYINYVFFAEAPTGATGQTVVGHGGTFAGQTKLNETDANEPTAHTVEIDVPDNAVWLMVDFGYAKPTELMIGKPIERWKFGGQIDKTVNGADIVGKTVDTPKLADGAITTEKLANRSVSTDKLAGYSTVCKDVPWELFLDGYGTSAGNTVESAACAIYSVKFEAGKTYCILYLPYPNNTNEFVTDPTDINYFGSYLSYYPSLPDVEANLATGKDRLYGFKTASSIQQVLLKAESDGYVEAAIPGQAMSMPPVYFTVKQDWYVLRASTKPDAGKRINNYYVSELQMPGISTLGNGMHGQSWYVYKKDLGNGAASDRGYLQQIFASKTASAENERAYAAMSRDVPRDRTLNIHFIGDSITWAASAGLQNAFRKYVPMNLRAETMALCVPGVSVTTGSGSFDWNQKQNTDAAYDAAMSGYSGLAQKLAEYKTNLSLAAWADAVDIVVVELGTNDHWEQATLGSPTDLTEDTNFYGATEKTLTLLEDTFPHAQILWMLPFKNQNWKTSTIKLVDYLIALKILCQMHTRCWVLDLFDKWFLDYDDTDLRSKFFIDSVHITGNAHKCVAESMIDKIRQIISVCGLRQTETVRVTDANDSVYGSANA
nr:MAG TPA: collagen triple helix repeat protein [Bacteriophage sp.]